MIFLLALGRLYGNRFVAELKTVTAVYHFRTNVPTPPKKSRGHHSAPHRGAGFNHSLNERTVAERISDV